MEVRTSVGENKRERCLITTMNITALNIEHSTRENKGRTSPHYRALPLCEAPPCATSRSTNTLLSFKVTTVAHHTCQNFCLLVVFYVCAYIGFQGHFHADKCKCLCLLVILALWSQLQVKDYVFFLSCHVCSMCSILLQKLLSPLSRMSEKSSLPGDSTAACSSALQSHFLLNILPGSCPRNLLKSIHASICASLVFEIFVLVFVFVCHR